MLQIGILYDTGKGVSQDYAQTMQWCQKAADKGNARAMACIGYLYENGLGIPASVELALSYYKKAADLGDQDAIDNLKRLGK